MGSDRRFKAERFLLLFRLGILGRSLCLGVFDTGPIGQKYCRQRIHCFGVRKIRAGGYIRDGFSPCFRLRSDGAFSTYSLRLLQIAGFAVQDILRVVRFRNHFVTEKFHVHGFATGHIAPTLRSAYNSTARRISTCFGSLIIEII